MEKITNCTQIGNCDTTMYDGCAKCDTNFALKYTITNDRGEIDYS